MKSTYSRKHWPRILASTFSHHVLVGTRDWARVGIIMPHTAYSYPPADHWLFTTYCAVGRPWYTYVQEMP